MRVTPARSLAMATMVLLASLTLVACGPRGSGTIVSEGREVAEFSSVAVSGGLDARITIDPGASPSVVVVFDDNLLDRIVTEVDGSTLEVRSQGSYNVFGTGRYVEIVVPDLVALEASGGSDVTGSGSVGAMSIAASGGADVDLTELEVTVAEVQVSGGANLTVNVTEEVTGAASGGADLTVLGDPAVQEIDVSGGADVNS